MTIQSSARSLRSWGGDRKAGCLGLSSGGPQMLTGAEINGTKADDPRSYEGTLAMHQHFAECIRDGKTPTSDIRDVIHPSRLVARLEGHGGR